MDFRRILEEARDEKGCATFETSSTDGLTEFLWPVVRDGTSTKESGTHHGDKTRRLLQVTDGGKKARNRESRMEFVGKKGYGGSGRLRGELRPT